MTWHTTAQIVSEETLTQIVDDAVQALVGLPATTLQQPQALATEVEQALSASARRRGATYLDGAQRRALQTRITARLRGRGFLEALLPPLCTTYTDLQVNAGGAIWGRAKGQAAFTLLTDLAPDVQEVWRSVESILTPAGRACTEATPSVDVKIPRDPKNKFGGARVKVIHPVIGGGEYPTIAIRLYEGESVPPAKLLEWEVMPETVLMELLALVARRYRIMVCGGTGSGKTTLLSALCHGIEPAARIVTIEDPQEIWLPHPNVTSLEARCAPPGSVVPPYTIEDGVADAMRLSPSHVIVGEVRRGEAALSLFNALMSDHAGLTTFHAESPTDALFRLAILMATTERQVAYSAGKALFALAVDLVIQVGWRGNRRTCLGVWEVEADAQGEGVRFHALWQPGEATLRAPQRKRV